MLRRSGVAQVCHCVPIVLAILASVTVCGAERLATSSPIDLGQRLELFVDDLLIERLTGAATQRMHHPVRRELAVVHDEPWEGNGGGYHAIFRDATPDGVVYRMYYHAWQVPVKGEPSHPLTIGYCESQDGVHWVKPNLGLFEFNGSKQNNIVLATINGKPCHDFSPFKDPNPQATVAGRYKAIGRGANPTGLYAFESPDAIHWELMNDGKPVMTGHPFDTQNIAFWDPTSRKYRAYVRDFEGKRRGIMTAESDDMIHWSERRWLEYSGSGKEPLYTNQVKPYYRAPHLLIGFPSRYVDRGWVRATRRLPSLKFREQRAETSSRYGSAVTDAGLMTSRDGLSFHKWDQAFLRPGLRTKHNWAYGDNYLAWHVVETNAVEDDAPRELSLYATESYFTGKSSRLRRYTLRIDGFASIYAPLRGGELWTRPIVFGDGDLLLNCSTSAAGSIRVEVQSLDGEALPGLALKDCAEIFGDAIEYPVHWESKANLKDYVGKPVRLRIELRDADLYALRFGKPAEND